MKKRRPHQPGPPLIKPPAMRGWRVELTAHVCDDCGREQPLDFPYGRNYCVSCGGRTHPQEEAA